MELDDRIRILLHGSMSPLVISAIIGADYDDLRDYLASVAPPALDVASEVSAPRAITATTYDAAGNLTAITEDGVTTTFTFDASGNALTETRGGRTRTFSYDAAGNLLSATVS